MSTLADGASIFVENAAGSMKLEDKGGNIVVRQSPVVVAAENNVVVAKSMDGQNIVAEISVVTDASSRNINVIVDESDNVVASVCNAVVVSVSGSVGNDIVVVNNSVEDSIATGDGSDIIRVSGGDSVNVESGADNDIVIVNGSQHIVDGGAGNDVLRIDKKAGNKILVNGGEGNDIITVAAGTGHILNGGLGNDKYVINNLEANGCYIIDQTDAAAQDRDTLSLVGYSKNDFTYSRDENNDLIMNHSNGSVITIKGWNDNALANIVFKDGIISKSAFESVVEPYDTIVPENSTMEWSPSASSNKLVFTGGYNNVTINNFNDNTYIDISALIDNQDINDFIRSDNDLILTLYNEHDASNVSNITFKNYYENNVHPIVYDGEFEMFIAAGTENDDVIDINASFGSNNLNNGKIVVYLAGKGNDNITVNGGSFALIGEEGNDIFNITDSKDSIVNSDFGSDIININWYLGNRLEIYNVDYADGDVDSINILNCSSSDFEFELDRNNIKLYDSEGGRLKIELQDGLNSANFQGINFKDGEVLSAEDIGKRINRISMHSPDVYTGTANAETFLLTSDREHGFGFEYNIANFGDNDKIIAEGKMVESWGGSVAYGGYEQDRLDLVVKINSIVDGLDTQIGVVKLKNYFANVNSGTINVCGENVSVISLIKEIEGNLVIGTDEDDSIILSPYDSGDLGSVGYEKYYYNSEAAVNVETGGGDDRITIYGGEYHTIYAGDGSDTIEIVDSNRNKIAAGNGNDTIMLYGYRGSHYIDNTVYVRGDIDALKLSNGLKFDECVFSYNAKSDKLDISGIEIGGWKEHPLKMIEFSGGWLNYIADNDFIDRYGKERFFIDTNICQDRIIFSNDYYSYYSITRNPEAVIDLTSYINWQDELKFGYTVTDVDGFPFKCILPSVVVNGHNINLGDDSGGQPYSFIALVNSNGFLEAKEITVSYDGIVDRFNNMTDGFYYGYLSKNESIYLSGGNEIVLNSDCNEYVLHPGVNNLVIDTERNSNLNIARGLDFTSLETITINNLSKDEVILTCADNDNDLLLILNNKNEVLIKEWQDITSKIVFCDGEISVDEICNEIVHNSLKKEVTPFSLFSVQDNLISDNYTQSAINSALSAVGNAELSFADTSLAASAQIGASSDEDKEHLLKVSGNF